MATASKVDPFTEFKSSIEPFLKDVKKTAINQLRLFKLIQNKTIKITDKDLMYYDSHLKKHYLNLKKTKKPIKPTLEIQLLWIVHALNPKKYFQDCQRVFKQLLPVEIAENIENGYCIDNNAYFYEITHCEHKEPAMPPLIETFDIKEAVIRQLKFVNKINNIQKYQEITETQIDAAVERYCKFLYVLKQDFKQINCPTLEIDFVWHSHQLNAIQYHKMSKFMFSKIDVIDHNDNIDENILKKYKQETEKKWNAMFGANDYMNGRAFLQRNKDKNAWKQSVISKKRKLDSEEQNETPNKRRKISVKNDNEEEDESDDMSYDELKEKLKKEIERNKKIQKKLDKYKRENSQLKATNSELESKLEEAGGAGCGGCACG